MLSYELDMIQRVQSAGLVSPRKDSRFLRGASQEQERGGVQDLPLEVVNLINVFARIELRRKQRAVQKGVA